MNLYELPVHPGLNAFPNLHPDEMEDMARGMKKCGQLTPVIVAEVDGEMMLIDGRQRLEACRIAGVEPTYKIVETDDALEAILRYNILYAPPYRSHSQRAVWHVLHGNPDEQVANRDFIEKAKVIVEYCPASAEGIIAGHQSIHTLYPLALKKKKDMETLAMMARYAPELMELIEAGELTHAAVHKVAVKRAKKDKQKESASQ